MFTTILKSDFETPLGTVQTYLKSNKPEYVVRNAGNSITTYGYQINLEAFALSNSWMREDINVETSNVWRWFATKINDREEVLAIYCRLLNPGSDTEFGPASGEYLDAIEVENNTHELHIGTEDTDAHMGRAVDNDWMPKRFEEKLGMGRSIVWELVEYIDFGFRIVPPVLKLEERIYFHFLVATNRIKSCYEYPNQRDNSTWLAVEQSKSFLDEYLYL